MDLKETLTEKTSAFYDLVGKSVASDQITIVDDGTIPNRRGSLTIDDEGTKSQNTVLIEKGKLKGFMHDRLNARLMKQSPTGNGRRQSYFTFHAENDKHIHVARQI